MRVADVIPSITDIYGTPRYNTKVWRLGRCDKPKKPSHSKLRLALQGSIPLTGRSLKWLLMPSGEFVMQKFGHKALIAKSPLHTPYLTAGQTRA